MTLGGGSALEVVESRSRSPTAN